ncbi:MAG TPA: T9SS type A sorting domain-containing protein, partial [Tenuifilaceae bacterium]|nr:T9SS type A sorting domain-containing protein [Tenuifilaceae bacterium]
AGNTNTIATEFSIEYDNSEPTLSPVTITSNQTPNYWVRVGKKATLNFTSNEVIENVVVSIHGNPVVATSGDGLVWAATYTFTEDDVAGTVTFSIDFDDLAGNTGVQVTELNFGGTNLTFDKSAPTFSSIVVSTSNISGTFSKVNDLITIKFTSSLDANKPTVTINGVGASLSGDPTDWTATHTLGAAETERLIPYTITAVDTAGNQSVLVSQTSDIFFDRTPPVISSATVPAGEYKLGDSFDVTITADDDIYDEHAVTVNGKGSLTINNQNNNQYKVTYNVEAADNQQNAVNTLPVSLQLEDFAGNFNNPAFTTATVDGGTLTIDTQLPVIGSVTSDAEGTDNLLIDSTILFTVTLSSTPETGLIVNPQEYNGVPLVWAPNGTGSIYTATYKVEPGHTDCPVPAQLGDVTLTDGVGNVSVAVPYNSVNRSIYATRPSAEILGTTTKCDDGTTVPITFSLTGATPFQLTYNNGTSTVGPIEVNDVTYVVNAESGTFTLVNLTDVNGNYTTTATQNATITVNPLPPLTFDVTSSPFNKDQTKVDLSLYVSDLPAHFSGYGVGADGWFYPQIIDPNDYDSPIPITYTYTDGNGCTNSIDDDVVVTSGGARIDDLESSYCNYADPFTITGFNPIGTTGWFEFESENTPGNSLTIDPSSLIAGNHTVVYKYIDGTSTFQAQKSFAVDSVGVNTNFITLLTKYCEDADDVSLTAIDYYPSGGTGHFSFSGPSEAFTPSVINSNIALFEPSKAPVNQTYQVSYYYTSPAGCESNLIQKSVTINPTPDVDFIIRDNYNFDEGDVQLEGDPTGGTFSSGTVIHNNGILKPSLFTPGDLYIKYAYTNQTTGCSNSIEKPTRIIKADEVISGLEEKYCYSTDTVLMECTPIVDGTIVGEFYSDRLGLIESYEPNKAKYPIAAIGNGEDVVRYRYSVVGTPYEVYTEVLVDSIGEVTIQNLLEGYCEDAAKIQISGFSSHGSGGGAFSYSGTSIAFEPDGDFANLRPTEENVGIYEVTYEYTSDLSNCKSDTTVQVEIYPLPEVSFELPTYYNIDDPNITLVGEPSGGIFSTATGVIANEFRPADFGVGPVTITYTYSDGNSCENSISKTVTIIGPSATITGLPATICIDGESINISGSSTNGLPGYFEGPGITNTEANKANFNPAEAGEGEHNIFYKYTSSADGTTLLYISQIIEVIDLGEVSILGFRPSMEYCKGEDVVSLTGTPQPGTFSGSGIVGNEFYPSVANVGTNEIVYTHTLSGCSISGSVQVTINPLPEVSIDVVQVCSNLNDEPIEFINNTTSIDEVVSWHWSFGAGEGTSEEFEPDYLYKTPGSKLVSLEAETVKGCSATGTKVINVGILPEANFSWVNECINGSATEFTSTSDGGVNIEHLTWFVDGVELTEVSDSLEFGHEFLEVGDYTVKLLVESEDGCKDSIEKVLHIQPLIAISELSNQIYFEDFEDNESYWSAGPVDENEENQLYSWAFGTPTGSINQPELGANTWFIGVNDADQFAEHSQLISPCYDLRSLTKPMIKFNLWSANEVGRNGTVLQYTIDNGLTWNIIGDVNTGINWYNSNSIKSQPGYQLTGWSINTDDWVSARHSLDMVREAENVRFRIAFAADGNSTVDFYGFGIDDIWIGNREQKLLLEYFTNATTSATVSANSTMRSIETSNYRDIAAIHYHTSSPVGDPFYSFYPAGPSSRELFYGVSQIPYALVNGDTENSFASANLSSIQPMLNIEMLKDPRMKIEVEGSVGTSVNLQATITMLDDFADEDLVLYCAIVQKIADVATPLNGQDEFYSVLRGFVPDPGGTLLKQNWESGESEIFTMSTTIPEGIPTEMLRAMVFVQNIEDGKIYQTEIFDASPSTSTNPNAENFAVSVYPNPARSLVRFSAPQIIEQATLVDISGRILDVLEPNSDRFEIPVDRLVNGIYFVRVKAKTGQAVVKFIKE